MGHVVKIVDKHPFSLPSAPFCHTTAEPRCGALPKGQRLEGCPNTAARPTGWEEMDPAMCDFVRDWAVHASCPDGPHYLPRTGADLLLNVHKTPS
jgi:hypothetical protein